MKIFFFLTTFILCSSCAVMYYPNSRNAPMFSGKGEVQCSVTTGTGTNLQAAGAVTNHIGVMANGMSVVNDHSNKHNYGEVGIGYYRNINVDWGKSSRLYVDVFGGYGGGNIDVYDDNGPKTLVNHQWFQGSYQKIFIQPSLGFKLERLGAIDLHLGIVHRMALVDFSRVSGLSGFSLSTATPIIFSKTQLFFHEPAFIIKAVLKNFYLTAQGGVTLTSDEVDNYNYCPVTLSVGLGLRLDLKKEKK